MPSAPMAIGSTAAQMFVEARENLQRLERAAYLARIETARDPLMRFALTYFQHRMVRQNDPLRLFVPPAWFHHELTARLYGAVSTANAQMAGAYARLFAKSTYGTEILSLYAAATEQRRNIVVIGAPSEEKEYLTRVRNVTRELELNDRLMADYPGLKPARDKKGQWVSYTDKEVILSNGCRIAGMPLGGNIRGQSYEGYRPDLVILDDAQTRKMARSPEQMRNARQWIEEDVIGSLGPGASMVFLGTYLSHDCLLSWLRKPPPDGKGWEGPEVPVENSEQKPNWPEMFPFEECRRLEREHGPRAYAIERLLKPQAESDRIFFREQFTRNGYNRALLARTSDGGTEYNGARLLVVQRVDPTGGAKRDANNWCAIATIGIDPRTEVMYLLGLYRLRGPYGAQVDACHQEYDDWRPLKQRIESNACQVWLAQGVLEERAMRVEPVNSTRGKHERMESWAILVGNDKVKFNLEDATQQALIDEAETYPLGRNDDLLDSVSGACEDALEHRPPAGAPETSGVDRESTAIGEEW